MKAITVNDGSKYFYTTSPYSVANPLGVIKATLTEYTLYEESNRDIPVYKLYKTDEGNCYDAISKDFFNSHLSANMKMAIDATENTKVQNHYPSI